MGSCEESGDGEGEGGRGWENDGHPGRDGQCADND